MSAWSWKLIDGVLREDAGADVLALWRPGHAPARLSASGDVRRLVTGLAAGWLDQQELDSLADAAAEPAVVYYALERLRSGGWLQVRGCLGGQELFLLEPAPPSAAFSRPLPAGPYRLSPRALVRREGAGFLLETPFSPCRCLIRERPCWEWLYELARQDQAAPPENSPQASLLRVLVLLGAVVAGEASQDLNAPEDAWELHDLWFYHRSSSGTHPYPVGATWRLKGRYPPAPVCKPCRGECLPLPAPTEVLQRRLRTPLCDVLAARRSGREAAERRITVAELSTLLHAAARIQRLLDDPAHPAPASLRPSPSGGALHSLEIYPLVRACDGLDSGAYRYEPRAHRLERVAGDDALVRRYLAENPFAIQPGTGLPQIKLAVTSRFLRDCWKYESLTLRLVLQDLGCLYQTLSLTATALGLASCVLGAVPALDLARALGVELFAEPPLGVLTLSAANREGAPDV